MISKRKVFNWLNSTYANCVCVGLSLSFIFWFTLINRTSLNTRSYLPPGWTILSFNNIQVIKESIENIILFLPFGLFFSRLYKNRIFFCLFSGILLSLSIEILQYYLKLGYFEIDDVAYNSIGSFLGILVTKRMKNNPTDAHRFDRCGEVIFITTIIVSGVMIVANTSMNMYRVNYYKELASIYDLDLDTPNLLVLNGNTRFLDHTDINACYNCDGTISLNGSSKSRTWLLISEFDLEPGEYILSELSGAVNNAVVIEMEAFNDEEGKFVRFSDDIGAKEDYSFVIGKTTFFRVYVGIYPCDDINVVLTPVLYKFVNH